MPIDGGIALSAALQVVFDRLCSRSVLEFFRRNKIIVNRLTVLRRKLLCANRVLSHAEENQIRDRDLKKMLDELKDVIYAAEDLTERVNGEVDLRRSLEDGSGTARRLVMKLIPSPFDTFGLTLERDVEDLLLTLDSVVSEIDSLLTRVQNNSFPTLVTQLPDKSNVNGRDADAMAIVNLLLSDEVTDGKIHVIAILGMVGVGKTTVLQLVYHCDELKDKFDIKVWVSGSNEFDVTEIAKTFLRRLTPERCAIEDDQQQIFFYAKEALREKKVLFVIDGVWKFDNPNWESLMGIFTYAKSESKIVITTCDRNVAMMMGSVPTHYLHQLSKEDCWKLFFKLISGDGHAGGEALEPYATILYQKCRGVPLAVKLIAGMIRSKARLKDWRSLLESDIMWLEGSECDGFVWALWLSYSRLPPHLKDCFSYLSVFPRDYEFEKEGVILLWMAEGFLKAEVNRDLKEIGEEHFHALVSRSLLEQSSENNSTFIIHPILHDLINFVSSQFCCRLDGTDSSSMTSMTRRLSFRKDAPVDFKNCKDFDKVKYLRTFLALPLPKSGESLNPLDYKIPHESLSAGCLRVLSLSQSSITKLPDWFRRLKQLRYLDLSSSKIKEISDDIYTLVNLMILLLANCKDLLKLPTDMGKLVKLQHVDICGTPLQGMPIGLKTFTNFIVNKEKGSRISELRELQHLCGELKISGLQNISCANDALNAKLCDKKLIRVLSFEWHGGDANDSLEEQHILHNLRPHTELQKLSISGYGGITFPDWMTCHLFSKVVEVRLQHCRKCCFLPPFQHLVSLKRLVIDGFNNLTKVDHQSYDVAFRCLEILKISNMPIWNLWSHDTSDEADSLFPCLQELHLHNCQQLNVCLSGCFPSLETLEIHACKKLMPFKPRAGLLNNAFASLQRVNISNCPEQELFLEGGLPSSINTLSISGCGMLRAFDGCSLYGLVSLTELNLDGCNALQRLPQEGLPDCLSSLSINNCSLLKARCQPEGGEDWSKISSIRLVVIDNVSLR